MNLKRSERSGGNIKNIVSIVSIAFLTWCITFLYYIFLGISTITEFALVFIVTGLFINGIYYVWSITSIKRKMTREFRKENRLYAERQIAENPNDEATQILYGRNDYK